MKVPTIFVAGAALAAGVDAQGFRLPSWMQSRPSFPVPSFSIPNFGPPSVPTAAAGGPLANPNVPAGQTQTAAATAYGGFRPIVPAIPTATSQSTSPLPTTGSGSPATGGNSTVPVTSNNSTTNGTVECIADAKSNPNQAHSAQHRCNWAPGFDINTDVETSWPNTGKVVKYTLTITNGTISPQGDSKIGFLVNGQNPGPTLEANWGDILEVTVINKLQNNGTGVHWHGFQQKKSNLADGVGGVTECPVAPGDQKTYRFQATSHGTSWYHSHFSGQYGDGVLGPIVINGPTSANYDTDLGTIMVSDYYPLTAFQEEWLAKRFGPPSATNYLLNGKNVKISGAGGERSKWQVQPGKKHKIRLINSSTDHHFKVQIDQHEMTVVAADFVAIKPYKTKELAIGIGQRYDVIIEANQAVDNYWFRALLASDCSFGANDGTGVANGILSYAGASGALPSSKLSTPHSNACVDEPLEALKPVVTKVVDSGAFAANSQTLPVGAGVVRTNNDTVFQWTIGGISQVIDWSNPTMSNAVVSANQYSAAKHVVSLPNADAWTYWVLQNQFFVPHPMHLHGHDFAILGQGNGIFNAGSAKLNFANPARRDVVQLIAQGWTVIAFKTDNPGAWLMHCHIAWHVSGGLSLQFLERPNDIPGLYASGVQSSAYKNTCDNWKKYAGTMVYKQSDSGLKRREIVGDVEMDMEVMEVLPERRDETAAVKAHMHEHVIRRKVSHWGTQAA